MSSLPGYTLEDFVAWQLDLIVVGYEDANTSLAIAEAMGQPSRRRAVTLLQFRALVNLYEAFESEGDTGRAIVERRLGWFNEDEQSWRGYAGSSFEEFDAIADLAFKMASTFNLPDYVSPKWSDVPVNDPYDDEGSPHGKWAAWMAELTAYCTKAEAPNQCVLEQGHKGDCVTQFNSALVPAPPAATVHLDVAMPDTAHGVIVGPEVLTGPNAMMIANSVRMLTHRMKGRKEEEEAIMDTLDHLHNVHDAQAVLEEQEALSFLSIALGYREEIERRWAKDYGTSNRLRMYGYEVHPIPCPIYGNEMTYIPGDVCECGYRHGARA